MKFDHDMEMEINSCKQIFVGIEMDMPYYFGNILWKFLQVQCREGSYYLNIKFYVSKTASS